MSLVEGYRAFSCVLAGFFLFSMTTHTPGERFVSSFILTTLPLKGRFWHQRTTVLDRVGAYIMGRIPEIIDVAIDDPYQLTDEANDAAF